MSEMTKRDIKEIAISPNGEVYRSPAAIERAKRAESLSHIGYEGDMTLDELLALVTPPHTKDTP